MQIYVSQAALVLPNQSCSYDFSTPPSSPVPGFVWVFICLPCSSQYWPCVKTQLWVVLCCSSLFPVPFLLFPLLLTSALFLPGNLQPPFPKVASKQWPRSLLEHAWPECLACCLLSPEVRIGPEIWGLLHCFTCLTSWEMPKSSWFLPFAAVLQVLRHLRSVDNNATNLPRYWFIFQLLYVGVELLNFSVSSCCSFLIFLFCFSCSKFNHPPFIWGHQERNRCVFWGWGGKMLWEDLLHVYLQDLSVFMFWNFWTVDRAGNW